MQSLAIVHKGMEDIAAKEIKELIGADSKVEEVVLIFDAKPEELCLLCYKAQSLAKVFIFLGEFEVDYNLEYTLVNIKQLIEKIDFSDYKKSFMVECKRAGEHSFSSHEIAMKAIEFIFKKTKKAVDFKNPEIIFNIYIINRKGYFGIDIAGFDLSKREYKIFGHPSSVKGTIGYALVRLSGYDRKKLLLNPFLGSGVIAIEAALFASNFPVNFYRKDKFLFLKLKQFDTNFDKFFDKIDEKIIKKNKVYGFDENMLNVHNAKKNAKIAGVNKFISFSRLGIEWIDTKFGKGEVSCIATNPPQPSKRTEAKEIERLYKEFFYQAEFVLHKKGKIALISKSPELMEKIAKNYKFEVADKRSIWSGKEPLNVLVFGHSEQKQKGIKQRCNK